MSLDNKQASLKEGDKDYDRLKKIVDYEVVPEMELLLHAQTKYVKECLDNLQNISKINSLSLKADDDEEDDEDEEVKTPAKDKSDTL